MLKAIETTYNGYRFRSRLEARWAVFLDTLGVRYEYEPEGFELGNGVRYLPDFWLPDLGMWLEIKPDGPSAEAQEKAARLSVACGKPVGVCVGTPVWDGIEHVIFHPHDVGICDVDCAWFVCDACWLAQLAPIPSVTRPSRCHCCGARLMPTVSARLMDACRAARSARFEFGR